jgi:hypothetical protein
MTTNPQQPGATSVWHTGEWKDTAGSVGTTDAGLTEAQRVVVLGNRIQVVFGKHVNGAGGVWVTPPAARYGVKFNQGQNIIGAAVGLVVSDGEIGTVATDDVYRGPSAVAKLKDGLSVFRYDGMPDVSDGFDYGVSGTTTSDILDYVQQSISTTYTWTVTGTTSIKFENFLMRSGPGVLRTFAWKVTVNGAVKAQSAGVYQSRFDYSAGFPAPSTVRLDLTAYTDNLQKPGVTVYGAVYYNGQKATAAGASPISGAPISGGEGGTFQGLSCLAVRGTYLYSTEKKDPTVIQNTDWRSGTFNPSYTINMPNTRFVKLDRVEMRCADGAMATYAYELHVNGVLVKSHPGTEGPTYPSAMSFEQTFPSPVNVTVKYTRYDNKYYKSPFYLVARELSYTNELLVDTSLPMTFTDAVRCFVRNGVKVQNVLTGTVESSDSFADVVLYLLRTCAKVPDALIDFDSLKAAALFTAAQGFTFNGVISGAGNVRAYLQAVAPFFLLRFAQVDGRFALLPVLPATADHQLSTAAVTPRLAFDETTILAGSYTRSYIPASERTDVVALVSWRNQAANASYAVSATEEVRYLTTPSDAPSLQLDAEDFCTTAAHAHTVGKYVLARRKLITHTVVIDSTVAFAGALKPQDVITISLGNTPSLGAGVADRVWYRVESLSDVGDGVVRIAAEHFPVDETNVPLLTLEMLRTE